MSDSVIDNFLKAPLEDRARLALGKDTAPFIRAFLGDPAYDEYVQIATRVVKRLKTMRHLAGSDLNLIFVPGVMGSQLMSSDLGGVWWIDVRNKEHIDHLRLNLQGTDSADPRHRVEPFTTDPTYEAFRAAVLERDDFAHVVFPYDWRKSLTRSAAGLRDKVVELYKSNGNKRVHLVAHSMGGLLIRATLADYGEVLWPKIGRIVFIATPHYGSPAIAGYLKNHFWGWEMMALLGVFLSRQTLRSLWGVLELLPAPRGIYPGTRKNDDRPWQSLAEDEYVHPCANFDLHRADNWKLGLNANETNNLQQVLDGAAAFHARLYESHRALDQDLRERMAVIAGVGFNTLFRLEYAKEFFGQWERTNKITNRIFDDPHRDGDGRVPVASANLENVGQIHFVRGEHSKLPTIPAVYEDVFRWLNKETMLLPMTVKGALMDHLADDESTSKTPYLAATPPAGTDAEDPGYWQDKLFSEEQLTDLKARLADGRFPEFNRLHIL